MKKPTFVDDQLALNITLYAADSTSAPTGHYHQAIEVNVVNQNQELVAEMATVVLVRGTVKSARARARARERCGRRSIVMSELFLRNRWFEDIPVGEFHVFGTHTFGEQELVAFSNAMPHDLLLSILKLPERWTSVA